MVDGTPPDFARILAKRGAALGDFESAQKRNRGPVAHKPVDHDPELAVVLQGSFAAGTEKVKDGEPYWLGKPVTEVLLGKQADHLIAELEQAARHLNRFVWADVPADRRLLVKWFDPDTGRILFTFNSENRGASNTGARTTATAEFADRPVEMTYWMSDPIPRKSPRRSTRKSKPHVITAAEVKLSHEFEDTNRERAALLDSQGHHGEAELLRSQADADVEQVEQPEVERASPRRARRRTG